MCSSPLPSRRPAPFWAGGDEGRIHERSDHFGAQFSGAPLDAIKLTAAALMLADHINSALVESPLLLVWRFGRIAFPLFCLVLACHLARGIEPRSHALRLLIIGVISQPLFVAAFPWSPREANVLFTLAAAVAVTVWLVRPPTWIPHAVFAVAAVAVFGWPSLARTGVDFGLAGILLPAALTLALCRSRAYALWAALLMVGLNAGAKRPGEDPFVLGAVLDGLCAGAGGLIVVACAAALRGKPRFLPRYALHTFYPGHLLALATWRAWT